MELKYQNLTIRQASIDDVDVLYKWWNDGSVMAHAGFPLGLNISKEKITSQVLEKSDTKKRFILYDHETKIGEMSYHVLDEKRVEIGIKICEANFQNQGRGKIYLSLLIDYLLKTYPIIILDTNLNNIRAQHVYESLGFQKLRVNKDVWEDQVGVLQSSVDYQLTKETFISYLD